MEGSSAGRRDSVTPADAPPSNSDNCDDDSESSHESVDSNLGDASDSSEEKSDEGGALPAEESALAFANPAGSRSAEALTRASATRASVAEADRGRVSTVILVHSLDELMRRNALALSALLSEMKKSPGLRLVATVDHVNTAAFISEEATLRLGRFVSQDRSS
jgi:hypothetical protein